MNDVLTPAQRRKNMSHIRATDTKPELAVRRRLHKLGFRFRLHVRGLPGKPDLVFPGRRKVIFVNGCFWHSHDCRYGRVVPVTNSEFWAKKRSDTVARDARNRRDLQSLGWDVLVVWECRASNMDVLETELVDFLSVRRSPGSAA
ncbi:very short patch repair endonuclease [Okibacterium sp. HSC-33S16]|uniref:very short patch repair endonuclease n=1 Tax=Okibacterium sp. HSC-33S16 TaxID=2910965 RepID=UPI0020A04D3F|nr:very short patch repair endonuclease [Okibacterium sp. HSC-33S16]